MSDYDIVIIGSGPAAISAAITATIRRKKILVLGEKDLSQKVTKSHTIHNYPGLPEVDGKGLAKAFQDHLDNLGIVITDAHANMIYDMGDFLAVQSGQNMYQTETVILATGVVTEKHFEGEDEHLGKGVSYCATCDAALYPGKTAIVIAHDPKEEAEADFLAEYAKKVYYIPMYEGEVNVKDSIEVLHTKPLNIVGENSVEALDTEDGKVETDGIFILRESVAPDHLIKGIEMDNNHVKVDRGMATNIRGIYACGDITGPPYQYVKAAGEGNVAALSAVTYIDAKNRGETV